MSHIDYRNRFERQKKKNTCSIFQDPLYWEQSWSFFCADREKLKFIIFIPQKEAGTEKQMAQTKPKDWNPGISPTTTVS